MNIKTLAISFMTLSAAAITLYAQSADYFTVVKGNKVVAKHDAGNVSHISVGGGFVTGYNGTNKLFSHQAGEIDDIHFVEVRSVNGQLLTESFQFQGWQQAQLNLTHGQKIEVTGFDNYATMFQRHLFDINGDEVTFKGDDGDYMIYYSPTDHLFWLENRSRTVADGTLWLFGQGFGHQSALNATAGRWTWQSPRDVQMACQTDDGVFEVALYLGNDFAVKFFHQCSWGGEFESWDMVPDSKGFLEQAWAPGYNMGHFTGDYVPGPDFEPGVYTLRLDTRKKVCTLLREGENVVGPDYGAPVMRKVNGVVITHTDTNWFDSNTLFADVQFNKGQEVSFEGFAGLRYALSPDFFEFRGDKVYFKAPTGEYRIFYSETNHLIYTVAQQDTSHPNGLWLRGNGISHPYYDGCWGGVANGNNAYHGAYEVYYMPRTENGVYEATLTLGLLEGNRFSLSVHANKWSADNYFLRSADVRIVNGDNNSFVGRSGNNCFGTEGVEDKFTPGTYHIKINTNASPWVVNFTKYIPEADIIQTATDGGYLFAYMTDGHYGSLDYALSRDGYYWDKLPYAQLVNSRYTGHPDMIKGHDGAYYMIAANPLALWRTEDFVSWQKTPIPESALNTSERLGHYNVNIFFGAPKLFYDDATGNYIITWHAGRTPGVDNWDTMATFYVQTKDFRTFTPARYLFNFTGDFAGLKTIDTIIRKVGDTYYAITKDERESYKAPETGKTILLSKSKSATGPFPNPFMRITPNDIMREAPILIERPDSGFGLYAESVVTAPYRYTMFVANDIEGPWLERIFDVPQVNDGGDVPRARHGCIIRIPENVYQGLIANYMQDIKVNGELFAEAVYPGFVSITKWIDNGDVLTFTGIDDVKQTLQPHFFEMLDMKSARFVGPSGNYILSYDRNRNLIYLEQPEACSPDALWVCGAGWGHGAFPNVTSGGWQWACPEDCALCLKDPTAQKYTLTMFLSSYARFKFFTHRGWAGNGHYEITGSSNITNLSPNVLAVDPANGDFVTVSDFKDGFYRIVLDLDNRTIEAQAVNPEPSYEVNGVKMQTTPDNASFYMARLTLTKGQRVEFKDMGDVSKALQPEFYTDITGSTTTFNGQSGVYEIYYEPGTGLIYTKHLTSATFPEALWLCGEGWGHPQSTIEDCYPWVWNDVKASVMANRVDDNVYETTLYLSKSFKIKFFKQHGWGGEIGSMDCIGYPADMLSPGNAYCGTTGYGHFTGDFVAGENFKPGVYRIRIDVARGVCALADYVDFDALSSQRKINGCELSDGNPYQEVVLYMSKGGEVRFDGFGDSAALSHSLHPDFFNVTDRGKVIFTAPDGYYRLTYYRERGIVYCTPADNNVDGLWITGMGVGHPCQSEIIHQESNYGWDDPKDYYYMVPDGNGKYHTTLYLQNKADGGGCAFMIYPQRYNWSVIYSADNTDIRNECNSHIASYGRSPNFGADSGDHGFVPGIYRATLDTGQQPPRITFYKIEQPSQPYISSELYNDTYYALSALSTLRLSMHDGRGADLQPRNTAPVSVSVPDNAAALVEQYNSQYGCDYALMPASGVQIESEAVQQGCSNVGLKVTVNRTALNTAFNGRPFILPIMVQPNIDGMQPKVLYVAAPVVQRANDCLEIYLTGTTPTAKIYNGMGQNDNAVVFCPGGGYGGLTPSEIDMAKSVFAGRNTTLAVVNYRMPRGNHTLPATDAYNVLSLMRENRVNWGNYSKIGIMGCSAGGHVAATVAVNAPEEVDFQILLFPVITMGEGETHAGSRQNLLGNNPTYPLVRSMSHENRVNAKTPPAYIAWSDDDDVVPPSTNAIRYANAMHNHGRIANIYQHRWGGHSWWAWTDYPTSLYEWMSSLQ